MKVQWDEPVEFIRAYQQSTGTVPTRRWRVWAAVITATVVDGLILAFQGFFYLLHKKDLGVPGYSNSRLGTKRSLFLGSIPSGFADSCSSLGTWGSQRVCGPVHSLGIV